MHASSAAAMYIAKRQSYRIPFPALGRAAWATMIAAHAPALIGAWRTLLLSGFDPSHVGGCLALTLATAFFALKLFAWRPLRLPRDRRGFVAFWLIVALLHVDCVRPTAGDAAPAQWAVVATMGVLIAGPERISKAVRALLDRVESLWPNALPHAHAHRSVWLDAFRPHCWILRFRVAIPRSPPSP